MKSETRANFIFLGIFLLLMGPGLVILTYKGYKRGAAGINPPAPKTVLAYMNPNPQNPTLPRVVPPQTAEFVESIAYRIAKLQPELQRKKDASGMPILSERRAFELLSLGRSATSHYVALLGWDRTLAPLPSLYTIEAVAGGATVAGKLVSYEQTNLPLEMRDELQQHGYLLPPDSVLWMILEFPTPANSIEQVSIKYQIDQKRLEDRVILPQIATTAPAP